jgi:hypothetical protein
MEAALWHLLLLDFFHMPPAALVLPGWPLNYSSQQITGYTIPTYSHNHLFSEILLSILTLEDKATMLSQNTGNQIPSDASSYSRGGGGGKK